MQENQNKADELDKAIKAITENIASDIKMTMELIKMREQQQKLLKIIFWLSVSIDVIIFIGTAVLVNIW